MSYQTHKTIQTFYEAIIHYNLQEKNVGEIKKSGRVLILEDKKSKRTYFKAINR